MYSSVSTAVLRGIDSILVKVEADISDGMPVFDMVGSLGSEVREARERVRTALRNCGCMLPAKRITINLTPADLRKTGAGFDLPIAVAVMCALGRMDSKDVEGMMILGQLGLSGEILPIEGVLPVVAVAKESGLTSCMVPVQNQEEARMIADMEVFGVTHLRDLLDKKENWSTGNQAAEYHKREIRQQEKSSYDFSQVCGQHLLKRACEVAASGMHNLLMVGPPGAGKTMAAKCLLGILPPLNEEEKMELAKIYSVSGMFDVWARDPAKRPFRSPHHTVTQQGLAGGGCYPRPGEISLAHRGVLFLDELTEFQKSTLEILRQPMEEKGIWLSRASGTFYYPSDFMLVAAMNPCDCGYYPDMQKCRCSQTARNRYLSKLSQPLLDRIDICTEIAKISYQELTQKHAEEPSRCIQERVLQAREIQKQRFLSEKIYFNSQMSGEQVQTYCVMTEKTQRYMEGIYERLDLSARACHKILKVARTIADLDKSEEIKKAHINEAVCYRTLDKRFWSPQ